MSELTPNPIVLDRSGIDIVAHLNDAEREAAGDLAKTLEASLRAVVAELEPRVLAVRGNQDLSASGKRSRAVALAQEARKEVRAALTTATEGTSRAKKASEAKIPTSPAELKPDTKPEVLTWRELRAGPIRDHLDGLDQLERGPAVEEVLRASPEAQALEWLRAVVNAPVPIKGLDLDALTDVFTQRLYAEAWSFLAVIDAVTVTFRASAEDVLARVASLTGTNHVTLKAEDADRELTRQAQA